MHSEGICLGEETETWPQTMLVAGFRATNSAALQRRMNGGIPNLFVILTLGNPKVKIGIILSNQPLAFDMIRSGMI